MRGTAARCLMSLVVTILVAGAASSPKAAEASPESQRLIDQGLAQLETGPGEAALASFEAAAKADPKDASAVYFEGAALNRMMRHEQALEKLMAAEKMGAKRDGLDFEVGWALLGVGRHSDAVERLDAYEKAQPGGGKTSELLGRAYMGLKQYDKARAKLEEAARRDPGLAPSVEFYLAMLAGMQNDKVGVTQHLAQMETTLGKSAKAMELELPDQPVADKPWSLNLMLGAGYNSNVLSAGDSGLPGGAPLPADIRRDGSAFATMGLGASYEVVRTETDGVTVGYTVQSDLHGENDVHAGDIFENYWYAEYDHRFSKRLVGSITVADDYARVGRRAFSNDVMARGTLAYQVCDDVTVEGAYVYENREFLFGPPNVPQQDRDSNAHTLAITNYVTVPKTEFRGRVGYYHTFNRADGSDFDYDADAVFVFGSHPLPCDVNCEVGYTRIWTDYENRNSVAGPFGWAFAREDNIHVLSAELTRPLAEGVTLFLRYQALWNRSNIPEYDFVRHLYTGGLLVEF